MLLGQINGSDKLFYTTGRLTSEMVIKVAQMGVPILFSRAGITKMGLELSQKLGVTTISRAAGKHFLVYNGADTVIYDEKPSEKTNSRFNSSGATEELTVNDRRRGSESNTWLKF